MPAEHQLLDVAFGSAARCGRSLSTHFFSVTFADVLQYIGDRYTIALVVFFPRYMIIEFPSVSGTV
jgi:hypothetical protein